MHFEGIETSLHKKGPDAYESLSFSPARGKTHIGKGWECCKVDNSKAPLPPITYLTDEELEALKNDRDVFSTASQCFFLAGETRKTRRNCRREMLKRRFVW